VLFYVIILSDILYSFNNLATKLELIWNKTFSMQNYILIIFINVFYSL